MRWKHPEKGRIPAEEFIPVAEEIGSIQSIGHWVLSESISRMVKWRDETDRNIGWLSVNLSPKQLFDRTLIDQAEDLIERYDFDPTDLKLEITENALISNVKHVVNVLQQLRELGFQICMDDFGTGHSSLSLLQELPIDILKIDREFITDIQDHEDRRAIPKAVISLAEEMELTVIAEGVETKLELQQLQEIKCQLGQGFLFAKPMVENDYLKHLRNVEEINSINQPLYRETRALYVTNKRILEQGSRIDSEPAFLVMDEQSSFEVNSLYDFWLAEKMYDGPDIVFRVDGGDQIGMGHIYRYLYLAAYLADSEMFNCDVTFLSNPAYEGGVEKLRQHEYPLRELSPDQEVEKI